MSARRLFNGDSKTPLLPLGYSSEDVQYKLTSERDAIQAMILEKNRDHIISGRTYNTTGYVVQLIEELNRDCTVAEIVARSEGDLTDRSVQTGIAKLNLIIYNLAGLRFTLNKEDGRIHLVNESDVLMSTEKFASRFTKLREEFVRTLKAYEAQGNDVQGILRQVDQQILAANPQAQDQTMAELGRMLSGAKEEVAA